MLYRGNTIALVFLAKSTLQPFLINVDGDDDDDDDGGGGGGGGDDK